MQSSEQSILKIHASTTDRIGSKLLHQHIVELARQKGITGATVLQGNHGVWIQQYDLFIQILGTD